MSDPLQDGSNGSNTKQRDKERTCRGLAGSKSQSIVPLLLEFPLFCRPVAQVHVKSNELVFSFIFKNALDSFQVLHVYKGVFIVVLWFNKKKPVLSPSAEFLDKDRLK